MPFILQDRRDIIDARGLDATLLPGGVQHGDICYLYYAAMMHAWQQEPRWTTAHVIYLDVISTLICGSVSWDHIAAKNLAWQVFFNLHVMPYEINKRAETGDIGEAMPTMTAHALTDGPLQKPKPKPKHIYLAGPMRNIPQFNFPAFNDATAKLRALGYNVFNPAEHDNEHYGQDISKNNTTGSEAQAETEHGFSIRKAMHADLSFICEMANAVVVLPGHKKSRGARAEVATAEAIGIPVYDLAEVLSWGHR